MAKSHNPAYATLRPGAVSVVWKDSELAATVYPDRVHVRYDDIPGTGWDTQSETLERMIRDFAKPYA